MQGCDIFKLGDGLVKECFYDYGHWYFQRVMTCGGGLSEYAQQIFIVDHCRLDCGCSTGSSAV